MSHEATRYGDTLIFPACLDPDAVTIVTRLNEAGLESYFVGGCVRDLLVGLLPKDFDISTAARPRQIRRLFRNSRIIGRRFKLAHVYFGENVIEVATFRQTPEAESNGDDVDLLIRHDNVFGTAEEDVIRRDFTINALLYDLRTSEVIDYVGGVQDLKARILRTIGDPDVRFAEDPVRMLRAVKFMSRLEMQPSPDTDAALRKGADLILRSAPPRVLEEIYKLMSCGKAVRSLALFQEYGLLARLLPEIAPAWKTRPEELAGIGAALDRLDCGQRKLENSFLLACLFLPEWRDRLANRHDQDPVAVIRDLITPVAIRMSMPRRDVALVKQMLHAFARFENPPRGRRFRYSEFLARPSAQRALDLLYVASTAGLVDPELHAEWAQRAASVEPIAESEDATDRRVGGRRRRRRSGHRSSRDQRAPAVDPADESAAETEKSPDSGAVAGAGSESSSRDGSARRRPRRSGRRGGRNRTSGRETKPDAESAEAGAVRSEAAAGTETGQEGGDATSSVKPKSSARKRSSSSRRRRSGRKTGDAAQSGNSAGKSVTRSTRRGRSKDSDDTATPGQRHPEDVEDLFDW